MSRVAQEVRKFLRSIQPNAGNITDILNALMMYLGTCSATSFGYSRELLDATTTLVDILMATKGDIQTLNRQIPNPPLPVDAETSKDDTQKLLEQKRSILSCLEHLEDYLYYRILVVYKLQDERLRIEEFNKKKSSGAFEESDRLTFQFACDVSKCVIEALKNLNQTDLKMPSPPANLGVIRTKHDLSVAERVKLERHIQSMDTQYKQQRDILNQLQTEKFADQPTTSGKVKLWIKRLLCQARVTRVFFSMRVNKELLRQHDNASPSTTPAPTDNGLDSPPSSTGSSRTSDAHSNNSQPAGGHQVDDAKNDAQHDTYAVGNGVPVPAGLNFGRGIKSEVGHASSLGDDIGLCTIGSRDGHMETRPDLSDVHEGNILPHGRSRKRRNADPFMVDTFDALCGTEDELSDSDGVDPTDNNSKRRRTA